ncbi:hypothetical protein [Flavobacterium sp.]|uniref:hypothetical protein n=1 Tax=Flavobacterium sp. TaxID=239 RepID=UPI003527B7F7
MKSLVQVISEQLSVAVAPPLAANQSSTAPWLPEPSHSTTILAALEVISGAVVS